MQSAISTIGETNGMENMPTMSMMRFREFYKLLQHLADTFSISPLLLVRSRALNLNFIFIATPVGKGVHCDDGQII